MHARNEGGSSHARGHLRFSRFPRRTTEKRETARSLVQPAFIAHQKGKYISSFACIPFLIKTVFEFCGVQTVSLLRFCDAISRAMRYFKWMDRVDSF